MCESTPIKENRLCTLGCNITPIEKGAGLNLHEENECSNDSSKENNQGYHSQLQFRSNGIVFESHEGKTTIQSKTDYSLLKSSLKRRQLDMNDGSAGSIKRRNELHDKNKMYEMVKRTNCNESLDLFDDSFDGREIALENNEEKQILLNRNEYEHLKPFGTKTDNKKADDIDDLNDDISDDIFKGISSQILKNLYDDNKPEETESKKDQDLTKPQSVGIPNNDRMAEEIEAEKEVSYIGDISTWLNESLVRGNENMNLTDSLKRQLLNNADNVNMPKSDSTGWTQFNNSIVSLGIHNSQFHDVGPFFGLPSKVKDLLEQHKGIKELYSWQKECLDLAAVKERRNLVYALPTSGGKTLVAEILILRELLCYNRNVLFVLPFVSIVQEKVRNLSQLAVELGFLVEEYAAGRGVIPPIKRRRKRTVLIATIEKALAVVCSLIETKRLNEYGLVVVDELHLLSEGSGRGASLETLLTHILHSKEKIHVIGMTATIGNLQEVAEFMKAESYSGTFRPIKLTEYVKSGNQVYSSDLKSEDLLSPCRELKSSSPSVDPDGIGKLVEEVVPKDSALIFCPTKKNCENVALLLCKVLPQELRNHRYSEKESLYKAFQSESNNQVCPILKKTLIYGIGYHHSGLTAGERKLLEEAFRDGILCILCCTSTLAAGVNLPARRVILRSPYIGKDFINLSKYKQMIGRAGRSGMGQEGESFLICQPEDCTRVHQLLSSKMDESISQLDEDGCKHLILSAIGLGTASCRKKLRNLMENTLLHVQAHKLNVDIKKSVDKSILSLYKEGALTVKESGVEDISKLCVDFSQTGKATLKLGNQSELSVSRLGKAALKGCLSLEKAHELYQDLIKAQGSLVLLTDLHLLYLITPYEMLEQFKPINDVYFNVYMQLNNKELISANTIGITENIMAKLMKGSKSKSVSDTVFRRFYVSLILNELWKQQGVWEVSALFQVPRGLIQQLMTSASTFANNVLRFCEELEELWSFKALLKDFAPRIAHCCSAELLPLLELPAVKRGRAKQLYDAGFKTLQIIANSDPNDLVQKIDHMPKRVAGQIIAAAKLQLLEKAENLRDEADGVLEGLAEKVLPQ